MQAYPQRIVGQPAEIPDQTDDLKKTHESEYHSRDQPSISLHVLTPFLLIEWGFPDGRVRATPARAKRTPMRNEIDYYIRS
jgi:hypothetical protein